MDDTTKYVLFGFVVVLAISIPMIIRFCCFCSSKKEINLKHFHTQAEYIKI